MTHFSYWIYFNLFILLMLALDLGVFHKKNHIVSFKESLSWTSIWILLAFIFNYIILQWQGSDKALDFLTGYLIEKSLSLDNIFVIVLIFQYFHVPETAQHKVLFWGVLGALVMRAIFIFAGIELMENFHWIIYLFGLILIFTGIKMFFEKEKKIDSKNNPIINLVKKIIPVSSDYDSNNFFTNISGKKHATPLFLALISVETTDLIFAVDSIPAILSITTDHFIVYTSNAFAILGLRSLYFSLAGMMKIFKYLHYGLAAILIFVGIKMMLADIYHIPTVAALLVVLLILGLSIAGSLILKKTK